jgi:nucleoside-diphosphate-sugar epimerase
MIALRFSNVMDPDDYARFPDFDADQRLRRWNLWAYIDGRDGAQAVRLALAQDSTGVEVFVITDPDTVMSRRSADLAAEVYPDVPLTRGLGEPRPCYRSTKLAACSAPNRGSAWRTAMRA